LSSDERGSIVSLTNSSGALIAINRYDEYNYVLGEGRQRRFVVVGERPIKGVRVAALAAIVVILAIFAVSFVRGHPNYASLAGAAVCLISLLVVKRRRESANGSDSRKRSDTD